MTRAEMIERAQMMRRRDVFGTATQEELDAAGGVQTEFRLEVPCETQSVRIYRIEPKAGLHTPCPMVINFDGGGFIKGRQSKDQVFCSRLAEEFSCLVWDVDYSLSPEYAYPTAFEESYAVVSYVFAHAQELGVEARQIFLTGHSAGANLVAAVCLRAKKENAFRPAAVMMEYAPIDLATDPAEKPRLPSDMPAEVAKAYNAFYCDPETAKSPYVSPLFADNEQLMGFPDTLLMTAQNDSLTFEDEEFLCKLARAGVTVTYKRFPDSLHGFTLNRNGAWRESVALLNAFLHRYIPTCPAQHRPPD